MIYSIRPQSDTKTPVPGLVQMPERTIRKRILALSGLLRGASLTVGILRVLLPTDGPAGGDTETRRYSIALPDSTPIATVGSAPLGIGEPAIAISPDGVLVVHVAQTRSGPFLDIRPTTRYESTRLQGTDGAYFPFFSPKGRWIAFFAGNQLKKVSIDGGGATTLCETINPRGAVWGEDDQIYYADREGGRFNRVPSDGGTPTEIIRTAPSTFGRIDFGALLPGGTSVVGGSRTGLKVVSLIDGSEKMLDAPGSSPQYLPTGHLVFSNMGKDSLY